MTTIEFTVPVDFGETSIDAITVSPLLFVPFVQIWRETAVEARGKDNAASAIMQRKRMMHQVHFMSAGKRVIPDHANITQLPISVAKAIIGALDVGEGVAGSMLNDGDGAGSPAHYKLGTPIEATSNGKKTSISELEFQAKIFGDIEDVLATDGDVPQTLELIRKVAQPVGLGSINRLPGWAIDRLTIGDGVTIMNTVLPRFLG